MSADRQGSGTLPDLVVSRLYTAVVSDILDDLGHRDHVLDPAIRPLAAAAEVIAGPANPFLVTEADQIPAEPYTGEIAALDDVRPGEIILVAAGGSARAACWGELFSTAARARGARGTVIDGYCRDARSIAAPWLPGVVPGDAAAGLQGPDRGDRVAAARRRGRPAGPSRGSRGGRRRRGRRRPGRARRETIRLGLAKASKEHGLRDALEAGSTLRAAYDRFGVL